MTDPKKCIACEEADSFRIITINEQDYGLCRECEENLLSIAIIKGLMADTLKKIEQEHERNNH